MTSAWKRWREENGRTVPAKRVCGVRGEPGYACSLKPGHPGKHKARVKCKRKSWTRLTEDDLIEFGRQLHAADNIAKHAEE